MVLGTTTIHEDVFREIVRLVLEEVEGIYCYEPKNPLAPLLGEKAVKPVISVRWPGPDEEDQEHVSFEIKLAALYGVSIPQMVSTIRKEVADRVSQITGYEVPAVDVYITKLIRFENERNEEDDGAQPSSYDHNEGYPRFTDGQ